LPSALRQHAGPAWPLYLLIALAAFVAYAPAFDNGFMRSWDDGVFVTGNRVLQAPGAIGRIWTTLDLPQGYPNYPLVFTVLRLEYLSWGLRPAGYHALNILLHALNGILLFRLLRSLGAGRGLALPVALLFVLHPMQVESVAWITELKNVLFTTFFFGAFLAYRKFRREGSRPAYASCVILFACALLSKTTAVTLVASLFLADWLIDGRRRLRDFLPLVPLFALGSAAAWTTTLVEYAETSPPVAMLYRPFLAARALWFYTGKLFWPHPLLPVYPRWHGLQPYRADETEALSAGFIIAMIALAAALAALWSMRRRIPALGLWGLGHFVVSLLPTLGLLHFAYQTHTFVADRYVYVAMTGLFLAVGTLLAPVARRVPRFAVVATLAVLLLLLGALTWRQATLWRDASTLWSHTLRYNDESHEAHNSIGVLLLTEGRTDEAITHFERALQIKPTKFKTMNNLGNAYSSQKQYSRAISIYRRALELRPDYAKAHYNLGNAYLGSGRREEAIHHYREALRCDPGYVKARNRLRKLAGTTGG
jgi:tetratricopeptide (TPR) repeat protein